MQRYPGKSKEVDSSPWRNRDEKKCGVPYVQGRASLNSIRCARWYQPVPAVPFEFGCLQLISRHWSSAHTPYWQMFWQIVTVGRCPLAETYTDIPPEREKWRRNNQPSDHRRHRVDLCRLRRLRRPTVVCLPVTRAGPSESCMQLARASARGNGGSLRPYGLTVQSDSKPSTTYVHKSNKSQEL